MPWRIFSVFWNFVVPEHLFGVMQEQFLLKVDLWQVNFNGLRRRMVDKLLHGSRQIDFK